MLANAIEAARAAACYIGMHCSLMHAGARLTALICSKYVKELAWQVRLYPGVCAREAAGGDTGLQATASFLQNLLAGMQVASGD